MTRFDRRKKITIGILGGSFDPPHLGHLIIAEHVRESARLDKIIFVPAFQPPHKLGNNTASASHRAAMTRLAVRGNRRFLVSDFEMRKGGISYTVNTVRHLAEEYPSAEFSLIIGSDSFLEFPSWNAPEEIVQMTNVLVYPREGYEKPAGGRFTRHAEFLQAPLIEISSTMIRRRIREGKSTRYLIPESVEQYISEKKLYRRGTA